MHTLVTISPELIKRTNVAAVIMNEADEVLYCQRSQSKKFLPGIWHLPGGKVEEGEIYEEALKRELQEELQLLATVVKELPFSHLYSVNGALHQTLFFQVLVTGKIVLDFENEAYQFLGLEALPQYLAAHVLLLNQEICQAALEVPLRSTL